MKRRMIKALLFTTLFVGLAPSANVVSEVLGENSTGTYTNPILVNSVDDLKKLREKVSAGEVNSIYYKLTQDLDLNNEEWTPIGTSSAPFNAYFDGNGHVISNLKINKESENNVGLFGYLRDGSIEKLTVKGNVEGNANVGGIVGYSLGGVTNCSSYVNVKGSECVGGIIGLSDESLINDSRIGYGFANGCHNYGEIEGTENIGGIIGFDRGDGASRSGNYGKVTGLNYVGGIIGDVQQTAGSVFTSSIIDCFNVGEVAGTVKASGITSGTPEEILSSYNAGAISCSFNKAAAICCDNNIIDIKHCYNSGLIDDGEGVFAGYSSVAENCFSLVNSTEEKTGVSFVSNEELRVLASKIEHGFENNATVGRPILTSNKEVETSYIHILEFVPEIPATCTSTGVRSYYICHCGCGKKYFNANATYVFNNLDAIIPMVPHDLIEVPNPDGSVTHSCKNCDYEIVHYAINAEGNGSVARPYLINDESQLYAVSKNLEAGFETYEGVYFKQVKNIVLKKNFAFTGIGKSQKPFRGHYDGQMYSITFNDTVKGRGLFNELDNAYIKNVYLRSGEISSSSFCGSIAGVAINSTIENCYSDLKLTGLGSVGLGGIVGKAESCLITGCYFGGSIRISIKNNNLTMHIGGLTGDATNCLFTHCIFGGQFISLKSDKFDLINSDKNNDGNTGSYLYNINKNYNDKNTVYSVQWLNIENLGTFLEDNDMFDYAKEADSTSETGFQVYDDSISFKNFYNDEFPIIIEIQQGSNNTGTTIGAGNIALIVVGSIVIVGGALLVIFRKKIFKKGENK